MVEDGGEGGGWRRPEKTGKGVRIGRRIRSGSTQDWWAVEIVAGPYGPGKKERAIVATTDPKTLPDLSTWYLVTNLPAPSERGGREPLFPPASLEEVLRLYGLRMWVEQSYKQVKQARLLVPVSGAQRHRHPTALGTGVLRLLFLLVSCQPPLRFPHRRPATQASGAGHPSGDGCSRREREHGEKKSARAQA